MRELLYGGLTLIVIVAALIIGGGVVILTQSNVNSITNGTAVDVIATPAINALVVLASILAIVALALGGGMAIGYLVAFVGGSGGKGRG